MKNNNFDRIIKIVERAEDMELLMFDRISLVMDLECADKHFNLRLNELLTAKDFDFTHDICGIQRHINRRTKSFENYFVPRYASRKAYITA